MGENSSNKKMVKSRKKILLIIKVSNKIDKPKTYKKTVLELVYAC